MDLKEYTGQKDSQKHPWEFARYFFFFQLIKSHLDLKKDLRVLDVGSGDAWLANRLVQNLSSRSTVECLDIHYTEAIVNQLKSHIDERVQLSQNLNGQTQYDVILLLDVLEHIEDEKQYLTDLIQKHAHSDTLILISVPMWQWLFSEHDVQLGHYRRYSPALAKNLTRTSQLVKLQYGSLFVSLFVFRVLEKFKNTFSSKDNNQGLDDLQVGTAKGQFILTILKIDSWISRRFASLKIDFLGLSWWTVCKKKSS